VDIKSTQGPNTARTRPNAVTIDTKAVLLTKFGLSIQCTAALASCLIQPQIEPAAIASSSSVESSRFPTSLFVVNVILISPVDGAGSSRNACKVSPSTRAGCDGSHMVMTSSASVA